MPGPQTLLVALFCLTPLLLLCIDLGLRGRRERRAAAARQAAAEPHETPVAQRRR
jgi:hypothetical protein